MKNPYADDRIVQTLRNLADKIEHKEIILISWSYDFSERWSGGLVASRESLEFARIKPFEKPK